MFAKICQDSRLMGYGKKRIDGDKFLIFRARHGQAQGIRLMFRTLKTNSLFSAPRDNAARASCENGSKANANHYQPELPFIACTIGSFITEKLVKRPITKPENEWNRRSDISDVFVKLPSLRPSTACVDARDLKDGHIGDCVHYNSEAQAVIGPRFAEKCFGLIIATESKK